MIKPKYEQSAWEVFMYEPQFSGWQIVWCCICAPIIGVEANRHFFVPILGW